MLNILKFVKNAGTLEQQIVLEPYDRLEGLVTAPVVCNVKLQGGRDTAHKAMLTGQVEAELQTDCQVCMETIDVNYSFDFELYPVNEEQLKHLNDDQEPLITEDGVLEVNELVINELILSLPPVLTHEVLKGDDCSKHQVMQAGETVVRKKSSPFDVLKQLKSDDFNS